MKSIGEVATRFGLPTHVLRHWESEGLLTPARTGDRRRYSDADLYRVASIMLAKEADARTSRRRDPEDMNARETEAATLAELGTALAGVAMDTADLTG